MQLGWVLPAAAVCARAVGPRAAAPAGTCSPRRERGGAGRGGAEGARRGRFLLAGWVCPRGACAALRPASPSVTGPRGGARRWRLPLPGGGGAGRGCCCPRPGRPEVEVRAAAAGSERPCPDGSSSPGGRHHGPRAHLPQPERGAGAAAGPRRGHGGLERGGARGGAGGPGHRARGLLVPAPDPGPRARGGGAGARGGWRGCGRRHPGSDPGLGAALARPAVGERGRGGGGRRGPEQPQLYPHGPRARRAGEKDDGWSKPACTRGSCLGPGDLRCSVGRCGTEGPPSPAGLPGLEVRPRPLAPTLRRAALAPGTPGQNQHGTEHTPGYHLRLILLRPLPRKGKIRLLRDPLYSVLYIWGRRPTPSPPQHVSLCGE